MSHYLHFVKSITFASPAVITDLHHKHEGESKASMENEFYARLNNYGFTTDLVPNVLGNIKAQYFTKKTIS